jgi:hypothetical protein
MGTTIYPTVPVEGQGAQPAAEPWPVDEHTIRVDEMFARQLDNEFSAGVRGLLHDPETGVAAQSGEAALEAFAGALPALNDKVVLRTFGIGNNSSEPGTWVNKNAAGMAFSESTDRVRAAVNPEAEKRSREGWRTLAPNPIMGPSGLNP